MFTVTLNAGAGMDDWIRIPLGTFATFELADRRAAAEYHRIYEPCANGTQPLSECPDCTRTCVITVSDCADRPWYYGNPVRKYPIR